MNWNSPWISLIPLFVFNAFMLCTVLAFRPIYRKKGVTQEIQERHASKFLNRWMREYWFWLTDPIIRFFIRFHITPNQITCLGTFIGVLSGLFFSLGHFGLGGWCMIWGASFDMFDGKVARLTNKETKSGAYFDSIMDRVSEGAVFAGLIFYYRESLVLWIAVMALLGSFMVSYTKAKGDEMNARYNGGSMQRPERIVYLGVGAVFSPVFSWMLSHYFPLLTTEALYVLPLFLVALMTWVTSLNRMKNVMKMLDQSC
ncbi:MAG TPA: hypothetical protein DDW49_02165 [Deltaproteobacteria bacterium]|nr:MAG: hypothetical protein A2048_00765 [Deltaproteobacteria bacterium GWA2_45_12]HBF12189.1 hypothetical protein [Deltaproteobacteria bacterium]